MRFVELQENTRQWRQWRHGGIGGSDAPVICGVSRYSKVDALWLAKRAPPREPLDNERLAFGRGAEKLARDRYQEIVRSDAPSACAEHDEHPWLRASLDGWNAALELPVELKAPRRRDHLTALDGDVPRSFLPQCLHLLLVTGASRMHYASLHLQAPAAEVFALVEVTRDPAALEQLFVVEEKFWEAIQRGDKAPKARPLDLSRVPTRRIA